MEKVVVDRYIIVVGVMNVTRQSSSKNMNEHCLSNMDMSTMFSIQGELVHSVTPLGLLSGKFIFRKHLKKLYRVFQRDYTIFLENIP
jgi:hypothetical protein